MAEAKKAYVCRECGYDAPKWLGKCPSCGAWNSFDELVVAKKGSSVAAAVTSSAVPKAKPQKVQDIKTGETKRIDVGQSEVNRVLGGGLVPGSVILVGGEPGIGKSTLALQLALAENGLRTLYVSGEESLPYFNHYADRLAKLAGTTADIKILRGADTLSLALPVNAEGKLGVVTENFFKVRTEEYGFFESFGAGARLTAKTIKNYWDQLVLIVKPDTGLYKHVGGFIAIGNIFPSEWDWHQFWSMTAFLSIILAVMNIIPIPGLDGGHMIFTFWEMITGRKVSDKVLEVAQYIGMALILALVLFANGNDIYKLFK